MERKIEPFRDIRWLDVPDIAVVQKLAHRYTRQYPDIDSEDVAQVAMLTAIVAARKWRPSKTAKLTTYMHVAVVRALYRHTAKTLAPVHVATHALGTALLMRQVQLDANMPAVSATTALAERAIDSKRAEKRIHAHILNRPDGQAAFEVILGGQTVAAASSITGVAPSRVRAAAKAARAAIRADDVLRQHAAELP